MRLLLDTNIWLRALTDESLLTPRDRSTISDPKNDVMVSALSFWEVVIKSQKGKLKVTGDLTAGTSAASINFLPFSDVHALCVSNLPLLHEDPFDRGILAQALTEGLVLLTSDKLLLTYADMVDVRLLK